MDEVQKNRRYWNLKEEALYRILWIHRFNIGYGHAARQNE